MPIDRRLFLAGAAALSVPAASRAAITAPGASASQRAALTAIAAYLDAHRAFFALPAMGLVVTDGDFTALIQSGTSDYEARKPLTGTELWQIGSISKSFVALLCLQLADEHRLDLDADIRSVLPEAQLPPGAPFTIRGLLDHTTGLPDFAPTWRPDNSLLWRGFEPGARWSYSNTGYGLVGDMIARIEGRPLAAVIAARITGRLGMADTRGAIAWADRGRHTACYATLRPDLPVRRQNPLAPAPWVSTTFGAGSVASTLPDMARYLRFLIAIGNGRGAGLVSDATASAWLANPVVESPDNPDDRYGLGLMHRVEDGRRLLHHTGGMIGFSSSFHVDAAAGTGAFASCAIGSTGYRPRLLTAFAVTALRLAREGKPIPPPPALGPKPVASPGDYAGAYDGITITAAPLALDGTALEPTGKDRFVTAHPDFRAFPLVFVRNPAGAVVAIDHGARRLVRAGASAPLPATPPRLAAHAGRYESDDPWIGGVTLVARGERLWLGGTEPIMEIAENDWRVEDPVWSPERFAFAGFVAGRPQLLVISGRVLERRDV
ncbi:serine hydrolase domain-containing protein [Polymorphobacter fuscus]|uniref:Serine hydrolase n=1 Tax=Sandarakinorhabdus fusca TaxID=1439888 RepID=A0A7C9GN27_9SPHN|nr:serine hydrolase domain-containing protein [Polymorphobacter fuscus]KAB7648885.1 beta-lactamase family protein [Polymorphobacter fuscus]MQT16472.1 serine hydrolase [Polymorphobacter fuscus]NJC07238.1 CubicO group peptidase (beta-lactamase class C family) [Polymorphobacter fuscus]